MNKMKDNFLKRVTILPVFLFALFVFSIFIISSADAMKLTLKRVVFEGSKRAEVLTIINNSEKEKTYRIGWRHFRMSPDKSLVALSEDELTDDIKPVVDMVRFAPRRFTISGKSSQQVRMMLRTPANLEDGEYRSHLWIRPEADVNELKAAQKQREPSDNKVGINIEMLAGVTMPIIVRKGNLTADASIQGLNITERSGSYIANFSLVRAGNKSLYGDLDFICNLGTSDEFFLKTSRGIAIYTEVNQRNFNMLIEKRQDQGQCRTVSVTYSRTDEYNGNKIEVLAQETVGVSG